MNLYEEPSSKWQLRNIQSKAEFVELKEKIATTNNKAVTEDSSKVFIAELNYLRKHAFKFIETHFKKKLNLPGNADNGFDQIQYYLTVPAIWSDKAKDQMVQWAKEAKLISGKVKDQLIIVYEPDCASLSIQHAILRNMKSNKIAQESQASDASKMDINEWLTKNNFKQVIPTFKEEQLRMSDLIDLGRDPEALKEFLGVLELRKSTVIRICSKVKQLLQNIDKKDKKDKKVKNDKTKINPLNPQINIDVSLQQGDKYILLDVGGGTCDVACHEVVGVFKIAEVLHPSGGKWGATYIDERLTKLLGEMFTPELLDIFQMAEEDGRTSYLKFLAHFLNEAKLKFYSKEQRVKNRKYHDIAMPSQFVRFVATQYNEDYNEGEDCLSTERILVDLNKRLEMIGKRYKKPDIVAPAAQDNQVFNPTDEEEGDDAANDVNDAKPKRDWTIKIIEADDDADIEEDFALSMHTDIWKMLFDTIISPIIAHCKRILRQNEMRDAKYIFLVGGFANSNYFQQKMRKAFSSYKNVNVVRPGLPGLCVVDGAARYAMDKRFMRIRRLAKSYGIQANMPVSSLNLAKFPKGYNKYYNKEKNAEYVSNCFNVFVKRNEAIQIGRKGKAITKTLYKQYKSQTNVIIDVFATSDDNVYLAKDCGKALGRVNVALPKNANNGVIVEFEFDTNLTVYAYPKGKGNQKTECRVDYY